MKSAQVQTHAGQGVRHEGCPRFDATDEQAQVIAACTQRRIFQRCGLKTIAVGPTLARWGQVSHSSWTSKAENEVLVFAALGYDGRRKATNHVPKPSTMAPTRQSKHFRSVVTSVR
jgi:hypothetical protein